jgi:hypothetical protein
MYSTLISMILYHCLAAAFPGPSVRRIMLCRHWQLYFVTFCSHSSLLLSTWRVCSTPQLTKLLSFSFLEPKRNSLWFSNMPCLYQKILEWTRDLVGWYPLELSDCVLLLCNVMERGKKMRQDQVLKSITTRNYLWVVEWSTESVDFSRTTNGKSTTSCKLHEKNMQVVWKGLLYLVDLSEKNTLFHVLVDKTILL